VQKEEGRRAGRSTRNPPPTPSSSQDGRTEDGGYQFGNPDHQQFNPTDPNLLLYAHEGTWHEVDRTWTIRTDGTDMKLIHKRTMDMEINGHEWWSFDGNTVWSTSKPRAARTSGSRRQYRVRQGNALPHHARHWASTSTVPATTRSFPATAGTLRKSPIPQRHVDQPFPVQPDGTLAHERLANMANTITSPAAAGAGSSERLDHPDKKWVIFTGQFAPGQRHVYASRSQKPVGRPSQTARSGFRQKAAIVRVACGRSLSYQAS